MPVPLINRRKHLLLTNREKKKFMAKQKETKSGTHDKSEAHEYMDTRKKSDDSVSMNTHRKSDVEKSSYADAQEKGSGEAYVREFKEFPGVTIIIRTAQNPKAFAMLDVHGKGGPGSRRKSDLQNSQLTTQDKFEQGDKTDHTEANNPIVSTNNSNDPSGSDNQH